MKRSDGTMLNPMFWKSLQGQKHPGRWEYFAWVVLMVIYKFRFDYLLVCIQYGYIPRVIEQNEAYLH